MEPESRESMAHRRWQSIRRQLIELFLAAVFAITIIVSARMTRAESSLPKQLIAVLASVTALTFWFGYYTRTLRNLPEFEKMIATRALAIACAITVWVTTVWGLAVLMMGVPALPLAMVAPLAALIYAVIRAVLMSHYL